MFYRKGTWREVGRKGPAQIMGKCDSKGHAGLERQEWFSGTVFQFQSFWEKIKAKKKEEVLFRTERGTRRVCTWGVWYFLSNRCLRLCSFLLFNQTVVFCSLSGLKTQTCHEWTWISDLMCTSFPLPISGLITFSWSLLFCGGESWGKGWRRGLSISLGGSYCCRSLLVSVWQVLSVWDLGALGEVLRMSARRPRHEHRCASTTRLRYSGSMLLTRTPIELDIPLF